MENSLLHDTQPLGTAAHGGDDALQREVFVVGGGLKDGIEHSVGAAVKDWKGSLTTVGGSAAIGGALAYASECSSTRLAAAVVGGAFLYSMGKDLLQRAGVTAGAMKDAWSSSQNLAADRATVAQTTGPFVVDFALSSLGGGLGAGAMRAGLAGAERNAMLGALPSAVSAMDNAGSKVQPRAINRATDLLGVLDAPKLDNTAQDAYWNLYDGIVRIRAKNSKGWSTGTGVLTNDNGEAVTAYHVISNAFQLTAETTGGRVYPARLAEVHPGADLASIKIDFNAYGPDRPAPSIKPLEFADSSLGVSKGTRVFAAGYGMNAPADNPRFSIGTTAETRKGLNLKDAAAVVDPAQDILGTDTNIVPGFSGGPLIDEHSRLLGINVAKNEVTGQSFTVPIETVRDFLNRKASLQPDLSRYVPMLRGTQRSLNSGEWNQSDLAGLYEKASHSVFKYQGVKDGKPVGGSAFVVDTDLGLLVTSPEVIGDHRYGALGHKGVWSISANVVGTVPDGPAFLHVEPKILKNIGAQPVKFADERAIMSHGQRVVSFGFPSGMSQMQAAPGELAEYVKLPANQQLMNLDIPRDAGFAGAPLFDRLGQVIGMFNPRTADSAALRAVPSRSFVKYITSMGVKTA